LDKFVLVSDTHLGLKNGSKLWHDVTLGLFQTIADTCARRNISNIIHLGDFFHNRKHIHMKSLYIAIQIADILRDLNTYIITGNHDIFYKSIIDPTSLDIFREYDNIKIIKETITIHDDITLCPWANTFPTSGKILMGHFEIGGFPINQSYIMPENERLTLNDFKGWDQVFSGHFHSPSNRGNVRYIGAPYQMSFGDIGDRGFYILDNDGLEFINYTSAPKFIKIDITDDKDNYGLVPEEVNGNIVKLVYLKDFGRNINNKIMEIAQSYSPDQLYVDFSKNIDVKEVSEIKEESIKDNKSILFEYIDIADIPEHLDKKVIKRFVKNLLKG